ncbi:MAG: D-glycerate dehydrogenase [Beijerinckiaceae bacterium]|nr:D-glycerate dehydrogenase [Beijerinckiaceae bacterium]
MNGKKSHVVITRKLPEGIEARMRQLFDVEFNETDTPFTREALIAAAQRAEVLVPTVTDEIDGEIIAAAGPQLKLIAHFGNGTDNIDVKAAHKRGIAVTNTPGVLTEDMADFTMALIVAVSRRFVEGSRVIPGGQWSGWAPGWMLGQRISGKRLGIVGMGRIGHALAKRARAFGLQIHYHNRHPAAARIEEELQATYWDSLDRMLSRMDIVSVNCPHTPATFHLLSARRLKLLQPHAVLVNTARGEIVDEEALIELLEAGAIAGAGLDVFTHEPTVSPRLVRLAETGAVTLLPHMGSATLEARNEMGEKVIINIKTFTDGHRPPDRVLPEQ